MTQGPCVSGVTTDLAGLPRAQGSMPDIGAFEFGGQVVRDGAPSGLRIVER